MTRARRITEEHLIEIIFILALFLFSFSLTRSIVITCAITTVSSGIFLSARWNSKKRGSQQLFASIPQLIDYVISGVQSGLSLTEALINLQSRGPHIVRPLFEKFETSIRAGASFESSISEVQEIFHNSSADQFFEALVFAKSLGGSELLTLLRQLAAFTRQDLALRNEIHAKQSWVKNSAHISALAPWILLLLLSIQPSTAQSYATSSGVAVLAAGAIFTVIAYLWMARLSQLPESKRVFGGMK
jgi:tight adherence protein B